MSDTPKFPATKTVTGLSAPTNCCERHAIKLLGLAQMMGWTAYAETAPANSTCANCENEDKKAKS